MVTRVGSMEDTRISQIRYQAQFYLICEKLATMTVKARVKLAVFRCIPLQRSVVQQYEFTANCPLVVAPDMQFVLPVREWALGLPSYTSF
jgi:hypothetical protein